MRARTLLAGAVGAVGAAVLGNRALRRRAGDLENPLPGIERTYQWRGIETRYTAAGDPADPELVLVHGIYPGAGSHEFEPVLERLAERYRVYAIDLPGFGLSERPPLVYSSTLYTEFLRDVIGTLADEPTLIASSLTGSYAANAASDPAVDLEHLVLVCPTDHSADERPVYRRLLRSPVAGTTAYNLLSSKRAIRQFYEQSGFYDPANVRSDLIAQTWDSAHQPGARYAVASHVAGSLDPGPSFDLGDELASLQVPVTLVWGRDAERVTLREGRTLAETADCDLVVLDYATQLPHVEHPAEFVEYLSAELVGVDTDAGGSES
ncbi:alpha/beta fold hydrolase [Natrarchaeobaculum aegyptiacum]|uniref:Alpha/beta hydrolase n=1 Tax=Natrarchaeobaculum aegyptiacum TaxID=745377 RepID=A0A2Z2I0A5_9EURY|nr:alpha/beta fold hydrolase [Natrarchaeobaculum aegyptiacum]ARS90924.1 alpha/beta hydrolase [Natrarchaeobaculum aegyptiacum]